MVWSGVIILLQKKRTKQDGIFETVPVKLQDVEHDGNLASMVCFIHSFSNITVSPHCPHISVAFIHQHFCAVVTFNKRMSWFVHFFALYSFFCIVFHFCSQQICVFIRLTSCSLIPALVSSPFGKMA